MTETLKERYRKGWVTPDQLRRYAGLGVITGSDLAGILGESAGAAPDTASR